jgi:hypothetical protein
MGENHKSRSSGFLLFINGGENVAADMLHLPAEITNWKWTKKGKKKEQIEETIEKWI